MIKSIELKNFKAFGAKGGTITLAPITLLYGPNSAGKSSIIQALRLVQQPYKQFFDPDKLGSFEDLAHGHNRDVEIEIALTLDIAGAAGCLDDYLGPGTKDCTFRWVFGSTTDQPNGGRLIRHEIWLDKEQRFRLDCENDSATVSIQWPDRGNERRLYTEAVAKKDFSGSFEDFLERLNKSYSEAEVTWQETHKKWGLKEESPKSTNQSDLVGPAIEQELRQLLDLRDVELQKFRYIGPQRKDPREPLRDLEQFADSIATENDETYVGEQGEHLEDLLKRLDGLRKRTNDWLSGDRLGIDYTIGLSTEDGKKTIVLSDSNGVESSLKHVGYGVSQVLPILVQSLLGTNQLICVEQPELHIHPRLQAELGDVLIESTREPGNNLFIIETHSEMLALRLQRRIRQQRLAGEEVSILYIQPGPRGPKVISLRIDELGNFIDEWPDGFFEEGFDELFG
jgi:hypothetical protein